MADLSDLTGMLPAKEEIIGTGLSGLGALVWMIIIVFLFIIIGFVIYILIMYFMLYKYKIEIFSRVGNNWQRVGKDRACEVKYGVIGDTVFQLRKFKKYIPKPEQQAGKKLYWMAIREDGEWINVQMEDVDMAMKRVQVKFLHPEMRYARTSLQKGFKERYEKPKFMDKYGHIIIPLAAFALIGVFYYLIADKIIAMPSEIAKAVAKLSEVADKFDAVAVKLDNACTSSGIRSGG